MEQEEKHKLLESPQEQTQFILELSHKVNEKKIDETKHCDKRKRHKKNPRKTFISEMVKLPLTV